MHAGLRSREAQATLADLAACPCISLLASFEHVNTPLLWDGELTAAFNWLFFDITSFQPYTGQAVGLPPLLASARYVLKGKQWVWLSGRLLAVLPQMPSVDGPGQAAFLLDSNICLPTLQR